MESNLSFFKTSDLIIPRLGRKIHFLIYNLYLTIISKMLRIIIQSLNAIFQVDSLSLTLDRVKILAKNMLQKTSLQIIVDS